MQRALLYASFAVTLTTIALHVISAGTKTVSSMSIEKTPVCVNCPAGEEKNSLIEKSMQLDQVHRGLWIWNTNIVTDTNAQHDFLVFAQLKNINGVYLYAYDFLPDSSGELRDFIAGADDISIEVELLAGDPTWALTPTHPVALDFVRQAITFTESITGSAARPIGVHLDTEPYALPEWESASDAIITQYLDLLNNVKQELTTSTTPLTFTVDIPFWFDTITTTYKSATKPLNQHVQDIVDRVAIMDYRDFAEGSDGIIYHAQNEMNYAQSITKEVVIGVETNKVEPEKVTFFEEGEGVMEEELAPVKQHYQASPAFHGFAIHDYAGYRVLSSKRVYLPIIFMNYDPALIEVSGVLHTGDACAFCCYPVMLETTNQTYELATFGWQQYDGLYVKVQSLLRGTCTVNSRPVISVISIEELNPPP